MKEMLFQLRMLRGHLLCTQYDCNLFYRYPVSYWRRWLFGLWPRIAQELELPPPPSEEALLQVDELIKTLSSLNSNYQNSQYYIPSGTDRDVVHARDALNASLMISEDYFPRELWLGAKRCVCLCQRECPSQVMMYEEKSILSIS